MTPRWPFLLLIGLCLTACAELAPLGLRNAPPLPQRHVVSAAHPLAAEAGLAILRQGGSAVDAAIAVQAVLGLVEPQSSGIGGGAFLLHWDRASRALSAFDGRETAPAAARPDMFLGPDGTPLPFLRAAKSGKAVGVPGVVALLALSHDAHGRLAWQDLFEPAIRLADEGFRVSPRLHEMIAKTPGLGEVPAARALYFTPAGEPLPVGATLRNPAYADTLRRVAAEGPDGFYKGPVARAIVEAVRRAPQGPQRMTMADLAGYTAKRRDPLCGRYRSTTICGMPPPSSGGVTVLALLKLLEPFDMAAYPPGTAGAVHLITEASRLAYADRDQYLGDSDFIRVPLAGLVEDDYIRARSLLIDTLKSSGKALPGRPPAAEARAAIAGAEVPSTSHLSVVDDRGNIVSMTTTVEFAFGANLMAGGFILNNQLTDFAFEPSRDGLPAANAPAAGKRPRSSMAPTIVFDAAGEPIAALGSPGGNRIIAFVAQTLIGLIDWDLDLQSAIELPRHVSINGPVELEAGTPLEALAPRLEAMGHEVKLRELTSGLHGVALTRSGIQGGADPRREGVALGD